MRYAAQVTSWPEADALGALRQRGEHRERLEHVRGLAPGHRLHVVVHPEVVVAEGLDLLGQLHAAGPRLGGTPAGVLELPALGDERPVPQRRRHARGGGGVGLEVPPLDLDHHRQEVADVDRRDREHAVVVDVLVDDVDARVLRLEGLGPGPEAVELLLGPHREPVVVQARARHRRFIARDEEDELLDRVRAEDQPAPVLGHRRQLLEPEHLAVERDEVGPALLVEQIGGDAHRHVVEPGRTGGDGSHGAPAFGCWVQWDAAGTIITLPARSPDSRPCSASSIPPSGTSPGSMSTSLGKPGSASSSSARSKPSAS